MQGFLPILINYLITKIDFPKEIRNNRKNLVKHLNKVIKENHFPYGKPKFNEECKISGKAMAKLGFFQSLPRLFKKYWPNNYHG